MTNPFQVRADRDELNVRQSELASVITDLTKDRGRTTDNTYNRLLAEFASNAVKLRA